MPSAGTVWQPDGQCFADAGYLPSYETAMAMAPSQRMEPLTLTSQCNQPSMQPSPCAMGPPCNQGSMNHPYGQPSMQPSPCQMGPPCSPGCKKQPSGQPSPCVLGVPGQAAVNQQYAQADMHSSPCAMGAPCQPAMNQPYDQVDMHSSPCGMGVLGQYAMTSPQALTDACVQSCGSSHDPQFPPMAASQPAVHHSEVSGPMTDQPGDRAGANAALGFTPTNFGDCDLDFNEKPAENAGLLIYVYLLFG